MNTLSESKWDEDTARYFNTFKPRYSPKRLEAFGTFYEERGVKKVIDIGSGDGESVMVLNQACNGDVDFTLSDISAEYLPKQTMFNAVVGSILDEDFVAEHEEQFDAVQCVSLLHHLVGKSRRESLSNVRRALTNMAKLVRKDGYVVVFEPTWTPSSAMSLAFYIKYFTSKILKRRVEFKSNSVLNFGLPVVSYLTDDELTSFLLDCGLSAIDKKVFGESRYFGILNCKRIQYFLQRV